MFKRFFYLLDHPDIVEQAGTFDWSVIEDYDFDLKKITLKYLKEYADMTDEEINKVIDRSLND